MKIKATHGMVFFAVQVRNRFYLDMLRYDSCVPLNEEESNKLESVRDFTSRQWVIFRKYVISGGSAEPVADRWASFGHICMPESFKTADEARNAAEYYNRMHPMVAA